MLKGILSAVVFLFLAVLLFGRGDGKSSVSKAEAESFYKTQTASNAELSRAHEACARKIAAYLGVQNWGAIPQAKNTSSGNEFYFAWPKGRIGMQTIFGDVPISAACIGTFEPFSVDYVSVNGKDALAGQ